MNAKEIRLDERRDIIQRLEYYGFPGAADLIRELGNTVSKSIEEEKAEVVSLFGKIEKLKNVR